MLSLGVLCIGLAGCEHAGTEETSPEPDVVAPAAAPVFAASAAEGAPERMEVVFQSKVRETEDREIVASEVTGEVDQDIRDRVARPYRFVDDPFLYAEEAWSRTGPDGVTERGYRVSRRPNTTPLEVNPRTFGPPEINDNVATAVAAAGLEDTLFLDLRLRNFPEWNVPLAAAAPDMSPEDVRAQADRRARAIAEREVLFDEMAAGVAAQVEALGGRIRHRFKKGGWLSVQVPARGFEALAKNTTLARIDGPYGKTGGPQWSLGGGRQDAYLDADRFLSAGHDGEEPNPGRHSYSDIDIGVNEPGGYEWDTCAFKDGQFCNSASRIAAQYRCDDQDSDGILCETTSDLETNECDSEGKCKDSHGTLVLSVAIADYTDGQADLTELDDPLYNQWICNSNADCDTGRCRAGICAHSVTWENQRTGMAPEARAVLFGVADDADKESSFTAMFDKTIDLDLDISSNSWSWGTQNCDVKAQSALEEEIENAYDDGVLVVFSAGNFNGDDATSCQMSDPADVPKVLTVNAFDSEETDCDSLPATHCLLDRNSCRDEDDNPIGCSARGGGSVSVAGNGTQSNAVSIVDLVAPDAVTTVTGVTSGSEVSTGRRFTGTSAAAPHVSGLAALVKSKFLDSGDTWVNSPGRLHTLMLAMGDRHYSEDPSSNTTWTQQRVSTTDPWYGVGRARLRLFGSNGFGPSYWRFSTYTFTSAGTVTYYPFDKDPMPSGIELVKCVAMQAEDMSSKSSISEVKLTVYVRPNATGTSCTGTPTLTRTSDTFDTKKVAALEGFTFTNRCAEVQLEAENVTSHGVTVHTMCYYAGVSDDVSP